MALVIRTPRLELIASEPRVAQDEAADGARWHTALDVPRPGTWPPPLNDRASVTWFARRITANPAALGWYAWYVVGVRGGRTLIGNCGFKGPPDSIGSVEIGYSLLPEHQHCGFGTELASALVTWAFGHRSVARIMAETLPELVASVRVLEKHGFQLVGRGSTPESILFELRRSVFETRGGALTAQDSRGSQLAES